MVKKTQKDPNGNYVYTIDIKDHAIPKVIDYADEILRNQIIDPDEVLIHDEKIEIRFTYPLSEEVLLEYEQNGGFSRKLLFRIIYEEYRKIYDEEEQVGDPGIYENLYNRRESEGPYGIWGHYLDDLYLEIIRYDPKKKVVNLDIGS
ncbi:MAG: hypothetical protein ACFFE4_07260 [Candidatus Thorarchaeota archaeon]